MQDFLELIVVGSSWESSDVGTAVEKHKMLDRMQWASIMTTMMKTAINSPVECFRTRTFNCLTYAERTNPVSQ